MKTAMVVLAIASSLWLAQQGEQKGPVEDESISVVSYQDMNYPVVARVGHSQGVVVVQVALDNEGKVASSTPLSGPKALIPDAVSNAGKWRFRPNREKRAVIIYDFQLVAGQCDTTKNGTLFVFRAPNVASVVSCSGVWQPANSTK
jgi:hypothetical protein